MDPTRPWEAHLMGKGELQTMKFKVPCIEERETLLYNFWDHHSHTVRKASQGPRETLLLQPEGIRCNSQNLQWLCSLAYQYWQVWVAWSFHSLDIPACHSAQGFVQKALVGQWQQGDPVWATLQAGLQNRPKLICKMKGKDRQHCGKHCAFYSLIYFSSFFKCKMIYNNVRKKKNNNALNTH